MKDTKSSTLIAQEYLSRHDIHVPIVRRYPTNSHFFIRTEEFGWLIFEMRYHSDKNHPSYYEIRTSRPSHNVDSPDKGIVPFKLPDSKFGDINKILYVEKKVHWDEFEDVVLGLVKRFKNGHIALDSMEAQLAAWEMLFFIYDGFIAKTISEDWFFKAIDPTQPIAERKKSYESGVQFIMENHVRMGKTWQQIQNYLSNYAYWLAELVATNGE